VIGAGGGEPAGVRAARRRGARALAIAFVAVLAAAPAVTAQPQRNGPLPQPLPLFPPDNWWNLDVSAAPVDPRSAAFIEFIGATRGMHPDFGGDAGSEPEIYGFPYASVDAAQPLVPVTFVEYGDESDAGAPGRPPGYPIPEQAKTQSRWIEGGHPGNVDPGGDRHLLIVDRDRRILYELYRAQWDAARGRWEAGSGAIFRLDANDRRPEGWTSADAAGLAVFPGLVRHDEVFGADPIRHAFRVTLSRTNGYVWPASHDASTSSSSAAMPLGARLRLRASKDISGFPAPLRKIFQAMKTYGLIVADNGSSLYVQGTYDTRWDNDVLNPAFAALTAGDFEVVRLGWRPATPPGPGTFHPLPAPCRLLDTRNPNGPYGGPQLGRGVSRVVVAAGRCGIPAGADALVADLQVLRAKRNGRLQVYAGNAAPVTAQRFDFRPPRTRVEDVRVPLSGAGAFALRAATGGPIHLVVEVSGWYD
jgi:hypothetical protein